jgi:hypothetical protein
VKRGGIGFLSVYSFRKPKAHTAKKDRVYAANWGGEAEAAVCSVCHCIPFTTALITKCAQGVYRNIQKCWSSWKKLLLFSSLNQNWNILTHFPSSDFMNIYSTVLGLLCEGTEGYSKIMELMGAFLQLFIVNVPEWSVMGYGTITAVPKVYTAESSADFPACIL